MPSLCPYFDHGQCRSCKWMEDDYSVQLRKKEVKVVEALQFLPGFRLESSVKSARQGFRNRAKMGVTGEIDRPVIGLLGTETLDDGRELLSCPIHHPRLNQLIQSLPDFITRFHLTPYKISEKKGELKGLIAFHSPGSDEQYLRFVLRSQECVARLRKLLPELQARFPSLVCVSANIQPIPHAILEGPHEIILTERKTIDHKIGELTLQLSPQAFVQTHFEMASLLYETAANWIQEASIDRVIELFAGQGAFSFTAARHFKRGLGIEINADAVRTANETARGLGLSDKLTFKCADATRLGRQIKDFKSDLILVNPPRRGLSEAVRLVRDSRVKHFLYSSCSIETLAEDLKELKAHYQFRKAQIFDMFPHTEHFETLVWLTLSPR